MWTSHCRSAVQLYERPRKLRTQDPIFWRNDLTFVDRPPLMAKAIRSDETNKLKYNKLLPNSDGPCPVLSVQQHALKIYEHGATITIWSDCATHAPTNGRTAHKAKGSYVNANGVSLEMPKTSKCNHARWPHGTNEKNVNTKDGNEQSAFSGNDIM